MAIYVRSERKMDYYQKETLNPGPGQYFQQNEKKKLNKRLYPPFYTSAERSSFFKKEEIPGPGSYDLIDKSIINNDTSFNNIKEENTKINLKNNYEKNNNHTSKTKNINKNKSFNNSNNNSFSNFANESTIPFNNNSILNKKNKTHFIRKINKNNSFLIQGYSTSDNNSILNNSSKSIKLGFLSKSIRFNRKENILKENEPGPGTYESIDYINNIILNNNKKKSKYGSGQKLMKASFKIEAGSLNRIISIPSKTMNGYIYSGQKDDKKEKNDIVIKNGLINNILFEKENSNNKINKDYKLIIDNNTKFEKNIPTSEYVGPGSYDIFTKEKGNSVLKWSKGFNINKINNKNELIKVQKVLDEMKKNGESINNFNIDKKINLMHLCRTNSFHFLVGKYQRGLNDINRKMLDNNINNKINTSYYCRDSFILDKSQIPGPGYYSKELIDQQKDTLYYKEREIQKKKEQKNQKQLSLKNYRKMQFGEETPIKEKFGSNCERFLNKSKSMEYLGPTTYFNEKNKFEPNKKPDILHHLKFGKLVNSFENRDLLYNFQESNLKQNVKEQLNNLDKINNKNNKQTKSNSNLFLNRSIADNPGPGEYDLSGNFIIPSFSQTTVMSSQVERFPYIEENTPGPGAYINAQDFKNEKIEEKLKKIVNHSNYELQKLEKNKRIEEIKESNKIKNEIPGAGKYNPGLQETINYKILSKINPRQSYQSPFLISSERFQVKKNDGVSPANYDPYKFDKEQKNLQYMVFGKSKRFQNKFNTENMKGVWHMAGPCSYDLIKDNWNKKTFNILFSGNQ